jgi:predicted nucleic acid-binding protein
MVPPLEKKITKIKDIPDNLTLECAVSAKAEYIVTGNIRHFDFKEYEGIKIVELRDLFISLGLAKMLYLYEKR